MTKDPKYHCFNKNLRLLPKVDTEEKVITCA